MKKYIISGIYFTCTSCLFAHDVQGNTSRALDDTIKAANASNFDNTINIKGTIDLTDQVRALSTDSKFKWVGKNIFVSGVGKGPSEFRHAIRGHNTTRGFVVEGEGAATSTNVVFENLLFLNARAKGGDGLSGGGGGLGAGGAIYVGKNRKVTARFCDFVGCSAKGGVGGISEAFPGNPFRPDNVGGGGGGLRGNGGEGKRFTIDGIGGGGGGFGGNGAGSDAEAIAGGAGGGASGFSEGNAVVNTPGKDFNGEGSSGQGGVGGAPGQSGGFGGGGGGGSDKLFSSIAPGDGGFGGGGGGSINNNKGGNGGFGGGGGGSFKNIGGNGGFGAGSGNGNPSQSFGSGPASANKGGNGAAFGGAIFVDTGGQLGLLNCLFYNNEVLAPGAEAIGPDIFLNTGAKLIMDNDIRATMRGIGGPGVPSKANVSSMTSLIVDPQVIKTGPGLLILKGDNTFEEGFQIQEGEVQFDDGTMLGNLELFNGTIASGDLEIFNGGNLINAGIVSPGNGEDDFGVFQISGNFINTGRVLANIQPGFLADSDLIEVDGVAHIGGSTLELFLEKGNYIAGTQIPIIEGKTSGQFASIIKSGPLANLIDVDISYGSVFATILTNRLFEDQHITAAPAKEVVKCMRAAIPITPGSDFAQVIEELGTLSDKNVNKALVDISPAQFGAMEWINARNNSYMASLLSQYQFKQCCSPKDECGCVSASHVWINGFGNLMNNYRWLNDLKPYTANAGGVMAGMDYQLRDWFYLGGSFNYVHTDLDWKHHGGSGSLNSYVGTLYGIYKARTFNLDFSLLGGGTKHDVRRRLKFDDVNRHPYSDFWGQFLTAHLGARGSWNQGCLNWGPFGLVDYHYFHRNGFHEHGADSLNLNVKSKNQNMLRAEAGLKGNYSVVYERYSMAPYFGLSYVGEFPLGKSRQQAHFAHQSCTIDVISYDSCVNLGSAEGGIRWTHVNGISFVMGYKGLFNTKTSINEIEGRLEWTF